MNLKVYQTSKHCTAVTNALTVSFITLESCLTGLIVMNEMAVFIQCTSWSVWVDGYMSDLMSITFPCKLIGFLGKDSFLSSSYSRNIGDGGCPGLMYQPSDGPFECSGNIV